MGEKRQEILFIGGPWDGMRRTMILDKFIRIPIPKPQPRPKEFDDDRQHDYDIATELEYYDYRVDTYAYENNSEVVHVAVLNSIDGTTGMRMLIEGYKKP